MGQKICKQPKKEGIEKGNLKKTLVDSNELHVSITMDFRKSKKF